MNFQKPGPVLSALSLKEGFAACSDCCKTLQLCFFALLLFGSCFSCASLPSRTHLELTDTGNGKRILVLAMKDGEAAVLKWRNSLFGLDVTERFVAERGKLVLTEVIFSDPGGGLPDPVRPHDLEDLYQTGGPFWVKGIHKEFSEIVFRIGEVGHPKLQVRRRTVDLKAEAGFGGQIRLRVRKANLYEQIFE
jgi:hypothetical protein